MALNITGNTSVEFYREDITVSECDECGSENVTYVGVNNPDDGVCAKDYLDLTPRGKRDYVLISEVPQREVKRTMAEVIFGANGGDTAPEDDDDENADDYDLDDEGVELSDSELNDARQPE